MPTETSQTLPDRVARLMAVDAQIRAAAPSEQVITAISAPDLAPAHIAAIVMAGYGDRPALGERAFEFAVDPATGRRRHRVLPKFETLSFRALHHRFRALASAWYHDHEYPLEAGGFVGILGGPSVDYTTVDLAAGHLGAVIVPLPAGGTAATLTPIIAETEPHILAVAADQLATAVECLGSGHRPRRLVVFDYHPEDDDHQDALNTARRTLAGAGGGVAVESLAEVLGRAETLPAVAEFAADPESLALLLYTSGSTGAPKGAIYPARLTAKMWAWKGDTPSITVHFMPLSHLAGRLSLYATLAEGGTAYFPGSTDMSTILEDMALVRPTQLKLVPRVCDMIRQRHQSEKARLLATGHDRDAAELEAKSIVREEVLGGRVIWALCGTASLSAKTHAFMEETLGFGMQDAYGLTEAGGVLVDNQVRRPPVTDYKLVDVPELGYFGTDRPYPRGELLVRSAGLVPGYFKRPELTAEMFDADGYYRTGDIMAELGPDRLTFLDRRNSVLKLSQGEFVTVSTLEAVYSASSLIRQIFVYGSSERAHLLAVIVPADSTTTKSELAESLRRTARESGLRSYEIPRDFLVESEPFGTGNGLLSGVGKLLRPALIREYGARLEQLYTDLTARQDAELHALRADPDRPVIDTVRRALCAVLGSGLTDLTDDVRFADLGGDSLSALSLATLLHQVFDVEVPVSVLTNPTAGLADLADFIELRRTRATHSPTFASIHGAHSTEIRAEDLSLDRFIDPKIPAAAGGTAGSGTDRPTILLTGANGYLGKFLCLELLERAARGSSRLICLVRGRDSTAARDRLDAAFASGAPELGQRFQELATDHLEVVAGDIAEPDLGLPEAVWRDLAARVDRIIHPAALVNHVLPYAQLFGPNVVGTAEVIRLAVTGRIKPVTYLSSVAVAAQLNSAECVEAEDIRVMSPVRAVDDSYAGGYGNSKWAGEVLLREAYDRHGLPVTVFRSDFILAHREYAGHLNVSDMFTRLILSLVLTGIAPHSFYRTDDQNRRQRAHYDGLPVDFVATAITEIGLESRSGFRTFNAVNPHDDDISLDTFVDWLIGSGHRIQRIDYDEWFTRVGTALRALPEPHRRNSLLPLLHGFRQPGEARRGSAVPADEFRAAVRAAAVGSDHDIPHLSAALIRRYTDDLAALGLLDVIATR